MSALFANSAFAAAVIIGAVGQAGVQKENQGTAQSIAGVYYLYPMNQVGGEPVTKLEIIARGNKSFSVRGLGQPWSGEGNSDGKNGFYNWVFESGQSGKTTITIHADGTLTGQVRGSGIDWSYSAVRNVRASQIAADPRGYVVATREQTGEEGVLLLYEVASGQLRRRLPGQIRAAESVAFTADGNRLVTVGAESSGTAWDVSLAAAARDKKPGSEADLERAWNTLAEPNASAAYDALITLASDSERAIEMVRKRVQPPTVIPNAAEFDRLVADLDSEVFATREKASKQLERLGRSAVSALQFRIETVTSLETKRRLKTFLDRHDTPGLSSEELRVIRALEFLEQDGKPAARAAIAELAKGEPTAELTIRAIAAKGRLERRKD